jgi:peroxiredoxin
LVQLQKDSAELKKAGVRVVGISYDSVDALKKFADRNKITFPLLSDEGSKTITAYGILNKEARGIARGVPYPGTYLLDRKGVVRAKLFKEGYRVRHTTEELIKATKAIK